MQQNTTEKNTETSADNNVTEILNGIRETIKKECEDENINYIFNLMGDDAQNKACHIFLLHHLLIWLGSDATCSQTLYEFINKPYHLTDKEPLPPELFDSRKNALQRAANVYRANLALRGTQAIREESPYTRAPYEKDGKTLYNYLDLSFIDAYSLHQLYLYEHLVRARQKNITTKKLRDGYEQLNELLKGIREAHSDKEFVVLALSFFHFEITYRFLFMAKISMYIKQNKKGKQNEHLPLPLLITAFMARRTYNYAPVHYKNHNGTPTHSSLFFRNLNKFIKFAFELEYNFEYHQSGQLTKRQKYIDLLCVFREYFSYSLEVCRNENMPKFSKSWTDADFSAAAKFLREDYRFLDELEELNLDDLDYDYIEFLYNNHDFYDQDEKKFADENAMKTEKRSQKDRAAAHKKRKKEKKKKQKKNNN